MTNNEVVIIEIIIILMFGRFPLHYGILDLHVGHVGGEAQKNILSILLWAPASVGEKHCLVCLKRLVAS